MGQAFTNHDRHIMKYRDDGRKFCEDTSFQEADAGIFSAGISAGDLICQLYSKTVYRGAGNFQHLFSQAVCGCGHYRRGIYAVSGEGAPVSGCAAGRPGIYQDAENCGSHFPALDGLFQRDAADHGRGGHGREGDHPLRRGDSAPFPVLYPGLHRGALVLLDVSQKPVEPPENGVCGPDADDGADPGVLCQPGMDESIFRHSLK